MPDASQLIFRVAIAFFALIVVAPPVLIALCFVPASWASASLIILLLMFALIGACVMKAQDIEGAIIRGLFSAGSVLLVFPAVFAWNALAGSFGVPMSSGPGVEETESLRNLLLVYDIAVGTSCFAPAVAILKRLQQQAGLDPNLASAELRQAFWEVRQLFHGGT
jgi:hypothetical protein